MRIPLGLQGHFLHLRFPSTFAPLQHSVSQKQEGAGAGAAEQSHTGSGRRPSHTSSSPGASWCSGMPHTTSVGLRFCLHRRPAAPGLAGRDLAGNAGKFPTAAQNTREEAAQPGVSPPSASSMPCRLPAPFQLLFHPPSSWFIQAPNIRSSPNQPSELVQNETRFSAPSWHNDGR